MKKSYNRYQDKVTKKVAFTQTKFEAWELIGRQCIEQNIKPPVLETIEKV